MSRRPIFVISLDGGAFPIFDRLIASGDMPTLAAMLHDGAHGVLRSSIPPITPVAWTSFLTGKRPGKHGVYDFRIYDPSGYRDAFVTSRAIRDATLGELLTAAGRRVAIVNLPMMYPPPENVGTVVSGFDTPSVATAFTQPPALRDRILAAIPDYTFVATADGGAAAALDDATFARFAAQAERSIEQRTTVARLLLADGPWDAFILHHQDTDALQHKLWQALVTPDIAPARWDRLRQVYRRLDAGLAEVFAAAPPDALRLIVSDHGFGPHHGRVFPNVLLRQWGFVHQPGRWRARLARSLRKRLTKLGLATAETRADRRWEVRVREHGFASALPVQWDGTRAYVAAAEIYGLLYLNLRGREPEGVVDPSDVPALLDELTTRFRAVRDPHDGSAVFADVLRGSAVDPVDVHGRRPDLILVPRPDLTVSRDLNDRLWLDRYAAELGTHRPEGVLLAAGCGIRNGRLASDVDLVDLLPTILAAAGVPVPDDVDGRLLSELFDDAPVLERVAAGPRAAGGADGGLSEDEEEDVAERLRALGYLA
jgi:predicted AlkP superfamily phosphohydrolase/phosphomutase